MRWLLDVWHMLFLAADPLLPARDFETRRSDSEDSGAPRSRTQAVAPFGSEVIPAEVAGYPGPLDQGAALKTNNRTTQPWTVGERSGITYRAEKIELLNPSSDVPVGEQEARPLRQPSAVTTWRCLRLERGHPQADRRLPGRVDPRRRGVILMGPDPEVGVGGRGNG